MTVRRVRVLLGQLNSITSLCSHPSLWVLLYGFGDRRQLQPRRHLRGSRVHVVPGPQGTQVRGGMNAPSWDQELPSCRCHTPRAGCGTKVRGSCLYQSPTTVENPPQEVHATP